MYQIDLSFFFFFASSSRCSIRPCRRDDVAVYVPYAVLCVSVTTTMKSDDVVRRNISSTAGLQPVREITSVGFESRARRPFHPDLNIATSVGVAFDRFDL